MMMMMIVLNIHCISTSLDIIYLCPVGVIICETCNDIISIIFKPYSIILAARRVTLVLLNFFINLMHTISTHILLKHDYSLFILMPDLEIRRIMLKCFRALLISFRF